MSVRSLKTILAVFVALMGLMYATQNVVNIQAARAVVGIVLSKDGHEYYPSSFGPAINSSALVWLAVLVIIALEYLAGLLAAKGAIDMWRARHAPAEGFNTSKKHAITGAGIGVIIWLGIFGAIGGAYFQMWQTELGTMSLNGAFQYAMMCAVVMIYLSMKDD